MRYKLTLGTLEPSSEQGDELRVLEWHVDVGQEFEKDDLLVEFETSKSLVEVRAPKGGRLHSRLVEAGTWTRVGAVLAIVGDPGDPGDRGDRDSGRDDAGDESSLAALLEIV
jgi:pyruvate/2-oxoglutarate dehydrogenase complex dihydrolipoamide acyltransferase (E2) component